MLRLLHTNFMFGSKPHLRHLRKSVFLKSRALLVSQVSQMQISNDNSSKRKLTDYKAEFSAFRR